MPMPIKCCAPAMIFTALTAILASAAAQDETAGTDAESVELVYTDLSETSRLMMQLPSILDLPDNVVLSSWKAGRSCAETKLIRTMFADGDYPGVVFLLCNADLLTHDANFRPIPYEMVQSYAPNLYKLRLDYPDLFSKYTQGDDMIAVPGINVLVVLPTWLPVFRKDWLEDFNPAIFYDHIDSLNISENISFVDYDMTLTELREFLQHVKANHGIAPLAAGSNQHYNWATLFGAFGLPVIRGTGSHVTPYGIPNTKDLQTDEVLPNVLTSQYRELVKLVASWLSEGLISEESLLISEGESLLQSVRDVLRQLLTQPPAVILAFPVQEFALLTAEPSKEGERTTPHRPETPLVFLPPPLHHGQGTIRWRKSEIVRHFMAMNAQASDPEIEAALRILDFVKLTETGYILSRDGVADETVRRPFFPTIPYFMVPHLYSVAFSSADLFHLLEQEIVWTRSPTYWLTSSHSDMVDMHGEKGKDINVMIDETFYKMVTGSIDTSDAAFGDFRSMLEKLGIMEIFECTRLLSECVECKCND